MTAHSHPPRKSIGPLDCSSEAVLATTIQCVQVMSAYRLSSVSLERKPQARRVARKLQSRAGERWCGARAQYRWCFPACPSSSCSGCCLEDRNQRGKRPKTFGLDHLFQLEFVLFDYPV